MKQRALLISCYGLGRGGVQAIMMPIVRHLHQEFQFDIVLFTEEHRYYDDEFESYGGRIIRVPLYRGQNIIKRKLTSFFSEQLIYAALLKVLKENGPYDIVHCHNDLMSGPVLKAAAKVGVPIRITQVHTIVKEATWLHSWIHRSCYDYIKKYATLRIGCSVQACKSLFGSSEFAVVNNMYDDKKFVNTQFSEKGEHGKLILLQVGSYSSNKNQLFSLDVLKNLVRRRINAELRLVGFNQEANYIENLLALAESQGLRKRIVLYPHDADIPKLLQEASCFMFPSLLEGFGIVLIEAQAMGVKCFVSDTVPKTTNVGGCTYLPLQKGAGVWCDAILDDFDVMNGIHQNYNCTSYAESVVIKKYRMIYTGGTCL